MNRESFLEAQDLAEKQVEIAKTGTVTIREMSAYDRVACFQSINDIEDESDQVKTVLTMAHFIVRSVIDAQGELMFTTDDVGKISRKNINTLNALHVEICEINGMGGVREEKEKNSEPDPS